MIADPPMHSSTQFLQSSCFLSNFAISVSMGVHWVLNLHTNANTANTDTANTVIANCTRSKILCLTPVPHPFSTGMS
jgi:hypothetical protein